MSYTNLSQSHLSRLYLTVALLVFLGALVWINVKSGPNQQAGKNQQTAANAFSYDGSLYMETANKDTNIKLDQPFEIIIYASSEGYSVVGYDVIVGFHEDNIEIDKVESLVADFTIYPFKTDEYYVATGVKRVSSTQNSVFSLTPILKVTGRAIKPGPTTVSILNTADSRKTQLVDNKTKILFPKGTGLDLVVN